MPISQTPSFSPCMGYLEKLVIYWGIPWIRIHRERPCRCYELTVAISRDISFILLPTAFEGWGQVMFSVCPHLGGEGTPARSKWGVPPARTDRGVPQPGQTGGGVPQPGLMGEVPQPGPDMDTWGGVPHGRDGVPSDQVRMGGTWGGVPHPPCRDGVPHLPGQNRGYVRWGTPGRDGVPPGQVRMGSTPPWYSLPPPPGMGQQMENLICRGQYTSCVHAGGAVLFHKE